MWWADVRDLGVRVAALTAGGGSIGSTAMVEPGATIDESAGPVVIGARTKICGGAVLKGPLVIGDDCLVGNNAMVRGPTWIGDGVRIGYATEIKQALIGDRATIGPMCFVADSRVDAGAYLGAMVRTSNHRLDGRAVAVREGDSVVETGCDKLGCWIGEGASLGIQVIILPGRVVAPGSLFEPRLTVDRNYPAGHYRLKQTLEAA
jgi:bifunctional UDP-N-acetylglucosamine pyrophosphorylase/glucosamine-1-phosphate N-acetyltransferase